MRYLKQFWWEIAEIVGCAGQIIVCIFGVALVMMAYHLARAAVRWTGGL